MEEKIKSIRERAGDLEEKYIPINNTLSEILLITGFFLFLLLLAILNLIESVLLISLMLIFLNIAHQKNGKVNFYSETKNI